MNCKTLKTYDVSLDNSAYEIIIGRHIINVIGQFLISKTKDKRVLIAIDDYINEIVHGSLFASLTEAGFSVHFHEFKSGKQNKSIHEAMKIYEVMESEDYARDSTLIAIGGGVIGDLAGFVASTYLRGMNLIHIPTTLTAMIDSSIGGKVAINYRKTINAIGNYYHPILNIIDLQFIDSLSDRDFRAGIAEIIKCSIICDKELFKYLYDNYREILSRNEDILLKSIYGAIEIKLRHVENDIKEQNKRLKLNYGHTIGHAIETSTGVFEEVYRHGEGVSLGMVGAAHIAKEYFRCGDDILRKHEEILERYGLPVKVESTKIGFDKINLKKDCLRNIWKDKKRKSAELRLILPQSLGKCDVYTGIEGKLIEDAFDYLIH